VLIAPGAEPIGRGSRPRDRRHATQPRHEGKPTAGLLPARIGCC
jgi:hypothetical protein